ncbi:UNVERIFIED_CONTAM: hypothetical protein GTU68_062592, partial [Idotea baltica]|nr:hypothetical protein [Idotea baltica]
MLGKKKGHKEVENIIEEKVIVKIEPDYAESSNNNYSSDDPQFDKMDCIKKEEEDDRDEGLYFDPQNLQVKVESLSDQELSDDYETMLYLPGSLHLGPHERALACRPPDPTSDQITLKCDECDFTSNRHSQLKRHKKYHARSEELRCPQCGHHFTTVYKMREHYRTHSGEKPYKCSLCPFSTSYP